MMGYLNSFNVAGTYCESELAIYCWYSDNFLRRLIQRHYLDEQFLYPDQQDQLSYA